MELPGTAQQVIEAVTGLGLEGVIAKRRTSPYTLGDGNTVWVKLKLDRQQEFVVGGYRPGSHGVDALLVGYYDGKDLRFAGKVRAGFTPLVRRQVHGQLAPLEIPNCPFVDLPNSKTSHWGAGVTPERNAVGEAEACSADSIRRVDSGRPSSPRGISRPSNG